MGQALASEGRAGAGGALASLGGLQAHGVAAVAQTVTGHSGAATRHKAESPPFRANGTQESGR